MSCFLDRPRVYHLAAGLCMYEAVLDTTAGVIQEGFPLISSVSICRDFQYAADSAVLSFSSCK